MALPRIPRNRAFILTQADQAPAMLGWLRHLGRVIAAGFLVKKPYQRPPATQVMPLRRAREEAGSLRERTELTQLRAENRRLRSQLEALRKDGEA